MSAYLVRHSFDLGPKEKSVNEAGDHISFCRRKPLRFDKAPIEFWIGKTGLAGFLGFSIQQVATGDLQGFSQTTDDVSCWLRYPFFNSSNMNMAELRTLTQLGLR